MLKKKIKRSFDSELEKLVNVTKFLNNKKLQNFDKLCALSIEAISKGNKIIFFGNGGSAADSLHLATELKVKYKKKRKALNAIALSADTASITAIANDFNFKYIFARQLEASGKPGDVAIALTTSGNSKNLIEACKIAKKLKIKTFCFSGNEGGLLKSYVNHAIIIPSKVTSIIQVFELFLGQIYCGILEEHFSKK
tara:strand:+ start:60 stop:647 length:588 start_codon:yes stop_codon:yes gene_type:complete